MKMNYRLHAKRRPNTGAKILFVIAICLILGYFARGIFAHPLSTLGYYVSNAIGFIIPPGFRGTTALSKENESLREKIVLLSAENADRNALAAENMTLKEGFGRTDDEKIVYAIVLRKPPFSPFDTFILDAGTNQGVAVGNTVVVRSLAIGTIVEVGDTYSKAELYSAPGKIFDGRLSSEGITLQVTGEGGGAFQAMLPIGTPVSEGDTLILPAITSKVFGVVEKVQDLPIEGFKKVLFSLPINPAEVSSVGIVVNE
jgi:cell shape-determining protein MreC